MLKINKQACIELGIKYINTHNCYPSAKGWTIKSAGCSRDRIYDNYKSWTDFINELSSVIEIPDTPCSTSSNIYLEQKSKNCKVCNTLTYNRNTYCSNACHHKDINNTKIQNLLDGKYHNTRIKGSKDSWLRRFLIEYYGEKCSECGIGNLYNNKYLLLEIDHINGRCHNNVIDNLRFLCPNCHSQTETYKAKNKSSDHKVRYLKVP